MFTVVWKKMIKNKWMTLCLLLGSLFVVNAMCIVPMYTEGILERMLKKDFEGYQTKSGQYPGKVNISRQFYYSKSSTDQIYDHYLNTINIIDGIVEKIDIPTKGITKMVDTKTFKARDLDGGEDRKRKDANLAWLDGFEDEIDLIAGTLPAKELVNGAYEVIVSELATKENDWLLNKQYELTYELNKKMITIPVKIVGVYRPSGNTLFWTYGNDTLKSRMIVDSSLFEKNFCNNKKISLLGGYSTTYSFDYTKIKMSDTERIVSAITDSKEILQEEQAAINTPMLNIFTSYLTRKTDMTMVLWVLQVPLMLMLVFYIVMVSKKSVDNDKNEISVLKSRGCTSKQVMLLYFLQSLILAAVAFLIGPFIAYFVCKVLGSANGFLEFVNRASLPVVITGTVFLYALAVGVLFIIMMLIPVYGGVKTNIVAYKVKKNRKSTAQLWQKLCLDFILLAGSLVILNQYNKRQLVLIATGADKTDFPVDPTVFIASTMFIIGAGLLFTRVYPLLTKLLFKLLKKGMHSTVYFAILNVSRSLSKNNFIMLFLILTLATGIFDANCARTINQNEEDRIYYNTGAQITLSQEWEAYNLDGTRYSPDSPMGGGSGGAKEIIYLYEPPIAPIRELETVEEATRVFSKDGASVSVGSASNRAKVMAVEPNTFNKVAWNRKGLNPYSMYSYLKTLASNPYAVLLSSNYRDEHEVKIGDKVSVSYSSTQNSFEGVVYGFVDYWPTYNPIASGSKTKDEKKSSLVIANLSYVQQQMMLEPFDLWISLKPDVTTEMFYNEIEENNIIVNNVKSTNQQMVKRKNDPMIQGINGMLTIGLILTMIVCFAGFLIYWILDIKSRTLQLGILRSMGLSKLSVIMILVYEQILVSLVSIVAGIVIGTIGSKLFVPILEIATQIDKQVPPYKVMSMPMDYIRVCAIVVIMLIISIIVLWNIIVKININQALKLGED